MDRLRAEIAREGARFGPVSALSPLVQAWPDAVGPDIAHNAWPARVARDGTLHVHTSSSAWAFELGQLEQRIRAALGDLAPARLRFAVGPLPEPSSPALADPSRAPVEPSPEQRERAVRLAAAIDDEDLRRIVAKAAALSLAAAGAGRSF